MELVKILIWSNGKGPLTFALFAAKKVDSGIAVEEPGQIVFVNNLQCLFTVHADEFHCG
jgi:hypothetical protein